MPVMLERWNDDKMDALEGKVDALGGQMREQGRETRELRREVRREIGGLRQEMSQEIGGLRQEINDMRKDSIALRQEMKVGFEQMYRAMFNGAIALTSGFVAGFAGLIVLIATLQ
jgi:predicted  nucleic acid-binding Zn-ribbon protein